MVYLDDILVIGQSFDGHLGRYSHVCERPDFG